MFRNQTESSTLTRPTSWRTRSRFRRALLLGLGCLAALPLLASAETWYVNSDDDDADASPGFGGCDTGQIVVIDLLPRPECTLRAAIQEANSASALSVDTIAFSASIPTPGGFVRITPGSPLPAIHRPTLLDGTTAPGFASASPGAVPVVQLDGSAAGFGANGLTLALGALGGAIQSVALYGFDGHGLVVEAHDTTLQGLHVGVRDGNGYPGNGGDGIRLEGATGANIGQTCTPVTCSGRGNWISANTENGIHLLGADGNRIGGNFIGTNATGTAISIPPFISMGNRSYGIRLFDSSQNQIGIEQPRIPPLSPIVSGNVVSGNFEGGILIDRTNSEPAEPGCQLNCFPSDPPDDLGSENTIRANVIGTDYTGSIPLPNQGHGIWLGSIDNTVGSSGPGTNVISGNAGDGIFAGEHMAEVYRPLRGNRILGNCVGVDVTGLHPLGNGGSGIQGTTRAIIEVSDNVIGANGGDGVFVIGDHQSDVQIERNLVGTGADGEDLGNSGSGIVAVGATIGGFARGNTIGFNGEHGIAVRLIGSDSRIWGNLIGTNTEGEDIGNDGDGIRVEANAVEIGRQFLGNLIGFNQGNGITLRDAHGVAIERNRIGVGPADENQANGGAGIVVENSSSTIIGADLTIDGDEAELHGNVIANHSGPPAAREGITILESAKASRFEGTISGTTMALWISAPTDRRRMTRATQTTDRTNCRIRSRSIRARRPTTRSWISSRFVTGWIRCRRTRTSRFASTSTGRIRTRCRETSSSRPTSTKKPMPVSGSRRRNACSARWTPQHSCRASPRTRSTGRVSSRCRRSAPGTRPGLGARRRLWRARAPCA